MSTSYSNACIDHRWVMHNRTLYTDPRNLRSMQASQQELLQGGPCG